jgi:ATP-dependent helicase/nuclease subunit B
MNRAKVFESPRANDRVAAVTGWLHALPAGAEALIVAPSWDAADDLLRGFANERGAAFAIHRLTLDKLIALLAAETLAHRNLAPAAGLSVIAVAARAIHMLAGSNALGHFTAIADRHGFASAAARTITELRLSSFNSDQLRAQGSVGIPLAALLEQYEAELAQAQLADRAAMISMAAEAIGANPAPRYVGLRTLFFDVPVRSRAEADFIAQFVVRAEQTMFTIASGDTRTEKYARAIFDVPIIGPGSRRRESSLGRLQANLFETTPGGERRRDDSVKIFSAPGEAREAVEIAREIHACARAGVPFDRIAILLRVSTPYNAHLEEALARAAIPAYFARGSLRPEPGGRALLTLLNCAAERLSARRFAEYLSLAQVPDPDSETDPTTSFVPRHDLVPLTDSGATDAPPLSSEATRIDDPVPVVEGSVRAPWQWEELIVEASVIGGRDRWRRRLNGLEEEFRTKLEEIEDQTAAGHLQRRLVDLHHLKQIVLPIIDALDMLPSAADWGEWLRVLTALTNLAIRDREPVLTALAELAPMAPVGPIALDEVRLVLAERLGQLTRPLARRRYGSVYVAPAEDACGLSFDTVFIPGLAERVFPQKLIQDPLLPDPAREMLGGDLVVQDDRRIKERLALRLAVGAAEREVVLSYPRLDIDQGRPRVPSFYALEAMRAAEGHLPDFEELSVVASTVRELRLGWPAPASPADAIDNAEFDLALLDKLVDQEPERTIGTANYLMTSQHCNPHLARSLRARARRWLRRWTVNDGLVDPDEAGKAALLGHALHSRSFSATALQKFAECPYRFALYTIMKLEPREEIEPLEAIDPLVRGAMFHEVQFHVLSILRERSALPVSQENLDAALGLISEELGRVADRYREKLAPAIERVWDDGIASISADLSEWLRRSAEKPEPWQPYRFELSFGLRDREQADPKSCEEPVGIAGGLNLRGSIDLVERDPARGRLRITDHKTGKVRAPMNVVVGGGRVLQPLLYSLAAERLLNEPVDSGRLYYCTLAGGFEQREVQLNDEARKCVATVIEIIGNALETGFFPAAPDERECRWCDYRLLCGPYEQRRSLMKPEPRLTSLRKLRVVP